MEKIASFGACTGPVGRHFGIGESMRLDKFLSDMGVGSRSEVKKNIRWGKVLVAGKAVRDPGFQVETGDEILYKKQPVRYEAMQYYMLHKPNGVISASEDKKQTTVVDLIRDQAGNVRKDLFPVGRLDKDTEGLLIITNDGALAHQLLAPKHHIDKVYYAQVSGEITEADQKAFEEGIVFDEERKAMPAGLRILKTGLPMTPALRDRFLDVVLPIRGRDIAEEAAQEEARRSLTIPDSYSEVEITIQEGKFHQAKKMVQALGNGKRVLYLRRISMGEITLDPALAPGEYRLLTEEELAKLKGYVKEQ